MSRDSFKNSIFTFIEHYNQYELSDQSKKLILYYFNESMDHTSYLRALEAISRYLKISAQALENLDGKIGEMLHIVKIEADAWDQE